jgi:hypothetical protein
MNLFTKLAFSTALALSVFSCAKPGCTDPTATNFSASAKKNDGSCTYSEKVIFWQDQATSEMIQNAGITGLYIYIDGQLAGSTLASNYWTGAPSCEQSGNVSAQIDLGMQTSKLITYEIKDNNGNSLGSDTYLVTAGNCHVIQL